MRARVIRELTNPAYVHRAIISHAYERANWVTFAFACDDDGDGGGDYDDDDDPLGNLPGDTLNSAVPMFLSYFGTCSYIVPALEISPPN